MTVEPTIDLRDTAAVSGCFREAAAMLLEARPGSCVELPAAGRLLVTGDLHDNPFHYARIIEAAGLDRGPDRHVVLHELIHGERLVNGMDLSYRMLGRIADLVRQFPGQVHPMLANHEIAQRTGRAVSKGAGNNVELFRDGIEFVFGDDTPEVEDAMNTFIDAMPLAVRSASGVLCAHSLPAKARFAEFDTGVLDRRLTPEDFQAPTGAAHLMTWGRDYLPEPAATLREQWGVSLFCLGHCHVDTGIEAVGDGVIVINSDHEAGRMLPIDLADPPSADDCVLYALPVGM